MNGVGQRSANCLTRTNPPTWISDASLRGGLQPANAPGRLGYVFV